LIAWGKTCPVSDPFGHSGRELLARLEAPEPWRSTLRASVQLIDVLDEAITEQEGSCAASEPINPTSCC
jgi:hypothetical protein